MRTIARKGAVPIDAALASSLGELDSIKFKSILSCLSELSVQLRPKEPGQFARQLRAAKDSK